MRQEDPLSPALFIMAMDVLQATTRWATCRGLLSPLGRLRTEPHVSIYADDAVIFFSLSSQGCEVVMELLFIFGRASGLTANLAKSSITTIRCGDETEAAVTAALQCRRLRFPITYLGLPLSIRSLRKSDFQPLVDKFSKKLVG